MLHRAALCRPDHTLFWTVCAPVGAGLVFLSLAARSIILQIPYARVRALSLDSRSTALLRIHLRHGATVLLWCDSAELLAKEVTEASKVGGDASQTEDGVMFSCHVSTGSYVLHSAVVTVGHLHVIVHTSDILLKCPVAEIIEVREAGHPCVIDLCCISKRLILEFDKSEDANKCRTLLLGYILLRTLKIDVKDQIKQFYVASIAQPSMLWAGSLFHNLQ
ncbi:hypothetical protein GL50803_006038 [Giardia duodenalis]|uniref:Uncharacterized protein n=1 Tax=Giardia intestinalis (strain ATCC 50803 / WB clone C6) TaxID=184922 RepID=D3KHV0_GIAIC|nr:hypothetical protein GL50803_006038 [Giardia intestinalis]KAE8304399.1 hypothetical protein GL50803_006038 [Giardia intestinalis]